jgi:anionic cell wall polymer biosynthesis LytR-Cps2A-Psr (LCP) family protein
VGLPSDSFFRYIEPGSRRLDGMETLWFARARYGSDDYSRMARQKCVMSAMLHQVSPQTALRNFGEIAQASSDMVSTSIPRGEAARFVQLALMAKEQKISTLSLVPPLVNTADPDTDLIHEKVQAALEGPGGSGGTDDEGAAPKKRKPRNTSTTGGSLGNIQDGYVANQSQDLGAAC